MALAGITSSTSAFPFKPILPSKTSPSPSQPPTLSSLSSLDSNKLFGFRFPSLRHLSKSETLVPPSHAVVSARYGGSRSSNNRRSRQSDSEDDSALDISTIRSANVRLIDNSQNMVGVVSKSEAIQMAEEAELDLVILSPDADPPVVRIMDYNKYRYEMQKKKKDQQKKSAATRMDLKELKMGYNIDQHDYDVRLKSARKFLKDGDKVKVIVQLKGRENEFRNIAIELIRRFQNDVGELATEESKNFRDRNIFITLVPNKALLQKAEEPPKKRDNSTINEVSAGV